MREYEALIIFKPDLETEALTSSFNEVIELIKKQKCEVENITEWGKKLLTFEITKYKQGIYYLVDFKAAPEAIKQVKRDFSLNGNILSSIITHRVANKQTQVPGSTTKP